MQNPLDLTGHRILVTGASSGIGREIAVLFSQLNARVVLTGRDIIRLEATRARLESPGHAVAPFDLENLDEIPGWIKGIVAEGGPLDGIVHSAGLHALLPLPAVSASRLETCMRVNLGAAVMLAKGFRQKGHSRPGGSLVYLSSVMGLVGEAATAVYAATKAALIGATRSLAIELAREGIRVNCIAPGNIILDASDPSYRVFPAEQLAALETAHPLGFGKACDVAHGAAYLMAGTGRWITGTTLIIDGGYTAR